MEVRPAAVSSITSFTFSGHSIRIGSQCAAIIATKQVGTCKVGHITGAKKTNECESRDTYRTPRMHLILYLGGVEGQGTRFSL